MGFVPIPTPTKKRRETNVSKLCEKADARPNAPKKNPAASETPLPVWKSKFYGAFLNRRVVLHAIDVTPARWRGDAGSSPLDGTSAGTSSPRNDLVAPDALVDFHTVHDEGGPPRGPERVVRRVRGVASLGQVLSVGGAQAIGEGDVEAVDEDGSVG